MLERARRHRREVHYLWSSVADIPTVTRMRPIDPTNPYRSEGSIVAFGPAPDGGRWQVRQIGSRNVLTGDITKCGTVFALLTSRVYTGVKWSNVLNTIEFSKCPHCGKFTGYDPSRTAHVMCPVCAATLVRCVVSNRFVPKHRAVTYNGVSVGFEFINRYYLLCDICGSLEPGQLTTSIQGNPEFGETEQNPRNSRICQGCLSAYFRVCGCGQYTAACSERCVVCERKHKKMNPIHKDRTTYQDVPPEFSYSVEVELSHAPCRHVLEPDFDVGSDGSVHGDGTEIRAGILWGDLGMERLQKLFEVIEDHDCSADRSCGGHIHIGGAWVTSQENLKLVFDGYKAIETVMFSLVPKGRTSNGYCKPLSSCFATQWNNGDRYHWLNLQAVRKFGTVEIRLAPGLHKWIRCKEWLTMHLLIIKNFLLKEYPPIGCNVEGFCTWLTAIGGNGEYWLKRAAVYSKE